MTSSFRLNVAEDVRPQNLVPGLEVNHKKRLDPRLGGARADFTFKDEWCFCANQ